MFHLLRRLIYYTRRDFMSDEHQTYNICLIYPLFCLMTIVHSGILPPKFSSDKPEDENRTKIRVRLETHWFIQRRSTKNGGFLICLFARCKIRQSGGVNRTQASSGKEVSLWQRLFRWGRSASLLIFYKFSLLIPWEPGETNNKQRQSVVWKCASPWFKSIISQFFGANEAIKGFNASEMH